MAHPEGAREINTEWCILSMWTVSVGGLVIREVEEPKRCEGARVILSDDVHQDAKYP